MKAEEALSHLKNVVFPGLVDLADEKLSFGEYMKTTKCKINKARQQALEIINTLGEWGDYEWRMYLDDIE